MKLRVRVNKQTTRVELSGADPTLAELSSTLRESVLPCLGYSSVSEFTLSLNGKEALTDTGQTLTACGIVSGDLICVVLPEAFPAPRPSPAQNHPLPPDPRQLQTQTQPGPSHSEESRRTLHHNSRDTASHQPEVGFRGAEMETVPGHSDSDEGAGGFTPEPMLCSEAVDGKVPHSLETLYHLAQSSSPCDALVVAVHLLMQETGYLPQGSGAGAVDMPAGWRAGGLYRLQYTHPLCEGGAAVLLAVPMGNILVINATLKINSEVCSVRKVQLSPSSYVSDSGQGESAADTYKDLQKLSRVFKDQLVYPLLASARQALDLPDVFGLAVLPPELKLRVLRLLDVRSVVSLSAVSQDLNTATSDPSLWRFLYLRDFRNSTSRDRGTDWKALYKTTYKQKRDKPFYPVPVQPYSFDLFSTQHNPPYPFYPPGIIGGEYDQRAVLPYVGGPGAPLLPGVLHPPVPRFDPIGPLPGHEPAAPGRGAIARRLLRPTGNRSADIRRGFI
ncbi:F-box only protein 7-like [Acipenser ruthenus]|uniref:F-box only protein 7-like n=1 Tax=Acipenser ruthenus TaxID=7906 RepID=UPI002740F342|nr:F-box only protein 7-like [Acipenser ruthenus]